MNRFISALLSLLALSAAAPSLSAAPAATAFAGENLSARPTYADRPTLVRPGEKFTVDLSVINESFTEMKDVEIAWTIGENSSILEYLFEEPIPRNIQGVVPIEMSYDEENEYLPLTFSVLKVNGVENADSRDLLVSYTCCSTNYSLRNVLIEKNTGIGCGYCPGAYYAFERMKEEVTDGSFIPVAVHNYSGDPLHCASYEPWNNRYVGYAAPTATYDRSPNFDSPPYYQNVVDKYKYLHSISYVDIYLRSDLTGGNLNVEATAHFSKDFSGLDYGFGFILTEDNLGPYNQRNYYAGGGRGPMGGFENEPSYVSLMYDDVARDIVDWEGAPGSIPADVTAGTDYLWSKTLSLSNCKNPDNVKVTAFIADRKTGEIVNAVRTELGTSVGIRPEKVSEANAVCSGRILKVTGDFKTASVYSTDGKIVGFLKPGESATLPTGLYIVRTEGSAAGNRTFKVISR